MRELALMALANRAEQVFNAAEQDSRIRLTHGVMFLTL
jgi:hypothetical protein